jgi:23S rRNA (cytidine2498-2'-O)-methyltransferase
VTHSILTCSPHFVDLALNELHRSHPETRLFQQLAPGYLFLKSPLSFDKLTAPWRHSTSIYLHHLFPVHEHVRLGKNIDELQRIIKRIAPSDGMIQIRSTDDEVMPYSTLELQQRMNGESARVIDAPKGRVLSALLVPDMDGIEAYLGVSWATQNLSPWAGGQMPITEAVSNRAGYKLLEALDVFSIRLREGNHALDLGAAPGAWTTLLRRRGMRVTAVAPAPMYPWLAIDRDVIHHSMLAQDFLTQCGTTFDLIVNDMMLDPQDSARLMVDYAAHLRREGIAIMTLKLREWNIQRRMDHALRILRGAYKIIQIRQLVSNKQEVTLFLRRKG